VPLPVIALVASVTAFFEAPPAAVVLFGYCLAAFLVLQLGVGYRRLRVLGVSFRRLHFDAGWAMLAVMMVHATMGVGHALTGLGGAQASSSGGHVHIYLPASPDNMTFWLVASGAVMAVLFAIQVLSGLDRFDLRREQFLALHSLAAWSLAALASIHAALATIHLILG
jgi:cytochrome b561